MKEKWTEDFQKKLDNYATTPPEDLFDNVLAQLPPAEEDKKGWAMNYKIVAFIATALSTAAAALLILLSNHTIMPIHNGDKMVHNNKVEQAKQNTFPLDIERNNSNASTIKSDIIAPVKELLASFGTKATHKIQKEKETLMAKTAHDSIKEAVSSIRSQVEGEASTKGKKEEKAQPQRDYRERTLIAQTVQRNYGRHPISLGLSVTGLPKNSSSTNNGTPILPTALPYGGETDTRDELTAKGQNTIVKKEHHRQPITFGLSIAVPISRKMSIETGLTYSYHSSDLAYDVANIDHSIQQKLHFVGIPLSLNYRLWQKNNVSVYVSGGGMVEKMVSGRQYDSYDGAKSTASHKVKMKQLQWSVDARTGVEYNIYDGMSLYLEPGVSYHFKNKSDVQTIYSAHPTSFEIKAGARFTLH